MFGGVLLVPFLVLAVLDVAVAYPSPDEELAAELEQEISAAGSDYTDPATDYTGGRTLLTVVFSKIFVLPQGKKPKLERVTF